VSDPLLLDTHALVWLVEGDRRLGPRGRKSAASALVDDMLFVSAISFWEIAMLIQHRRLELNQPTANWRQQISKLGIEEVPVSGDIAILAAELDGFAPDPADRIIGATAIVRGATLVTADDRILGWPGTLIRQDARR